MPHRYIDQVHRLSSLPYVSLSQSRTAVRATFPLRVSVVVCQTSISMSISMSPLGGRLPTARWTRALFPSAPSPDAHMAQRHL